VLDRRPETLVHVAAARVRPALPARLMVIAADHPAHGMLDAGGRSMADRRDLLERLEMALSRPGVNGVLGTPDILEELLLRGALEGKVVFGSMNRGGLHGAPWSLDDRFTGYDAAAIDGFRFDGGKMLLRIDLEDERTANTIEACARAVTALARRRLLAMVEPLWSDASTEGAIKAISIASALGVTAAYTWLKVPVVADMERVLAATTLPMLLLGGAGPADYRAWETALAAENARGLVIGRSLLYPADDDVATAVDRATGLVMA
jgi:hypothetical protein